MRWLASAGRPASAVKAERGVADGAVRLRITRGDAGGPAGLRDRRRGGRPPTYTPGQVGELIAAGLTGPQELGLPFASWTLDRLAADPAEERGIAMKRGRTGGILPAEGARWRTQETRFGARPEPAFADKRGPSSPSPLARRRTAR